MHATFLGDQKRREIASALTDEIRSASFGSRAFGDDVIGCDELRFVNAEVRR
jgi:hypothetical protein